MLFRHFIRIYFFISVFNDVHCVWALSVLLIVYDFTGHGVNEFRAEYSICLRVFGDNFPKKKKKFIRNRKGEFDAESWNI